MPHRNIWIRKEDVENWDSIDDKPEWLHMNLHKGYKVVREHEDGSGAIYNVTEQPKIIKTKEDAQKIIAQEVCSGHDHMRMDCGRKGCKYA